MKLRLQREPSSGGATLGSLFIDGVFECYTLEDVERPVKVPHETAIPAGTYKLVVDFSNRFQRKMPHVLNVPGFDGIRIHTGNTDKDTEGCILVGTVKQAADFLANSKVAFGKLFPKLEAASDMEIEIVSANTASV